MAKMYFKYGVMGSSKTAQALMSKFNYEEKGKKVWLIKPSIDKRDGPKIIKSRIGLEEKAFTICEDESILKSCPYDLETVDIIICDEAQFLTEMQVNELRLITNQYDITVFCFGLRTDFTGHLFAGSKRLFEIADTFEEIKSMCQCGNKATINARIDKRGNVILNGEQVLLGGNDKYVGMCWHCWHKKIIEEVSK